jgi:hypothetical protein
MELVGWLLAIGYWLSTQKIVGKINFLRCRMDIAPPLHESDTTSEFV